MKAMNLIYLVIMPLAFLLFIKLKNSFPSRKSISIKVLTALFLLTPFVQNVNAQWTTQNSGVSTYLAAVSFPNTSTGFTAGDQGKILKTTNGGVNWLQQTTGVNDNFNNIQFINTNTGWASGPIGYNLKTTNGGTNWFDQPTGFDSRMLIFFCDANTGFGSIGGGTIVKTTNGGANWVSQVSGTTVFLTDIHFIDNTTGWISGFSGVVLSTTNGGTNWTQLSSGSGNDYYSITFANSLTGWVTGISGTLRKTTNGGVNWTSQNSSSVEDLLTAFFTSASTGWITSSLGEILVTTNGGGNWLSQSTSTSSSLNSVHISGNYGWACGSEGTIIATTTGGFSAPTAPTLRFPSNDTVGTTLTPTLRWFSVAGAQIYHVILSTDSLFSTLLINDSTTSVFYDIGSGILQGNTKYFWRVRGRNLAGFGVYSSRWKFTTTEVTGITQIGNEIPNNFKLYNNYPNPFNPVTKIKFALPKNSQVKLTVFDMLGREAATLVNEELNAGTYNAEWNAANFSSGVYYYRMVTSDFSEVKKMILVK